MKKTLAIALVTVAAFVGLQVTAHESANAATNGITVNGITVNGITVNGITVNGSGAETTRSGDGRAVVTELPAGITSQR